MESISNPYVAPGDYLAAEREADTKHEYFDGSVVAMSGASIPHNLLVANLIAALVVRLRGGKCEAFPSDLRVRVGNRFFYPDVSVICGEIAYDNEKQDVVSNPTVIIEVLSDSTMAYDRGPKFLAYQQIPTLQDYLLVHQDQPLIEHYRRSPPSSWLYTKLTGLVAEVELQAIRATLPLKELYPDDLATA